MCRERWLWPPSNAAGKNYITTLPYVVNVEKYGLEVAYPWIMSQKQIVQVGVACQREGQGFI